jgi:hypothetical protein
LTAQTLETGIWLQTTNGFILDDLPVEAQFAPVYAIAVADINGDDVPDLLLGGNNVKTRVRIGDMSSSYVTMLLGLEGGSFRYSGEAGVKGEVRSFTVIQSGKQPAIFAGIQNKNAKIIKWKQ